MIEHPDWTPSELQQMHDLRALLDRKRGGVMFKTKPSRAQQFVLDEWMRENGPKPERQRRPGETYIHWPLGIASKVYVGIILATVAVTVFAGLNGALPEAKPEQRRPWFERHIEPMFPTDVQAKWRDERWRKALADLPLEQRELIQTKRAFPVATHDPDRPVELLPVDEATAREAREGRVVLIPTVGRRGELGGYAIYRPRARLAAPPVEPRSTEASPTR